MEIFSITIQCLNTPEVQEILKSIDSESDVLLTSVDTEDQKIEIQNIQPINQLKTIGFVPDEAAKEIFDKYGDSATIDVDDYAITFENGMYGIVADISVEEKNIEEPKHKRLPLPILIVVGVLTGLLTVVLVIIKLLKKLKKK